MDAFCQPGQYRLYVVSKRVDRKDGSPDSFGIDNSAVVSNIVEFDVLPRDLKWANAKLNEAIAALSKTGSDHRTACRTMRFLGTAAAVSEMRKRFRGDDNDCEWEYKSGLIGSPHRDLVIRDMENSLSSAEQPVTSDFLDTLTLLEFSRRWPALPPFPDKDEEQIKLWQAQLDRRRSSYDELRVHYLRELVLAIPQKQGQVRATSIQTLLDYHSEVNTDEFSQWSNVLASMSEVFNRLPLDAQLRLLTQQWKSIASAAMVPVLRGILKASDNKLDIDQQKELRSVALRRFYELVPEEGRRLILDEIQRSTPRVNHDVLRSLPDETLPEVDNVLATNLEQCRLKGTGDCVAISELIQRYATAEILSRVRAVYEGPGNGKWACRIQAALLAYFLRVDPQFGGDELSKAFSARGEGLSRCYTSTLFDVARLHMSAEVEEFATSALDDEDPEVVANATSLLQQFGSADAEKALWQRLEKWHETMQSRSRELSKQSPRLPSVGGTELSSQAMIEQALRNALTGGRAWVCGPEKLKYLRDLLLTDRAREEVDQLLQNWNPRIYVHLSSFDGEPFLISVAHYQVRSVDELKKKLVQFPKGTTFKWQTAPTRGDTTKTEEAFQQLKSYLEEHGMKLERKPEP